MNSRTDEHAAAEQALGYMYQVRFALLKMLELPEDTSLLIEADDDIDMSDPEDARVLGSLKHKAPGDRLTDLSPDFWKSVAIWLKRYATAGGAASDLRFFLFTTGAVQDDSFLALLLPSAERGTDLVSRASSALTTTSAKALIKVKADFDGLTEEDKADFLSRITIFDHTPRIETLPSLIMDRLRTVRAEHRQGVYERLEGWWTELAIQLMTRKRTQPVFGRDISDKLAATADQYKPDNLPIDFRGKTPPYGIDVAKDERLFVVQLKSLGLPAGRIQNAILDFYRAFEQRSVWAREQLLIDGEVEEYEQRLIEEWQRYREIAFEALHDQSPEDALLKAGKELFQWIELNTREATRIRRNVTEPYVATGSYHMLANHRPRPRVYWHPHFLRRVDAILTGTGAT
jgi:hypothetical protein